VRLSVKHRTTYTYGDFVTTSHHEARLTPRESESQRTVTHELTVTPAPESQRRRFDYFGNRALHFSLSEPHRSLSVLAHSVVELKPQHLPATNGESKVIAYASSTSRRSWSSSATRTSSSAGPCCRR
jgi:transglutaminase-like putative cysteine protease